MDTKIIVSSLNIYNYFNRCLLNAHPDSENPIIIYISKNSLSINNLSKKSIYVETHNKDDVYFNIDYNRLRRLVEIFRNLTEQPIVLTFDNEHNWLHISDAVI